MELELPAWVLGAPAAAIIALLAYRARALDATGAVAAASAGTIAVAAGWSWAVLLVAYFVSSTLLSRFHASERISRVGGLVDKHGPRDAFQVLANGGVFTVAAVGWYFTPDPLWQALASAALAASAADTWATEIGTLAQATPRSILDWSEVPPGTSGGVTLQGSLAGIAGAAFVGLVAWLLRWPTVAVASALVGGVAGCALDSWIGATLQSRRRCDVCGAPTEMRVHMCGTRTTVTGGLRWLNNDGVNAISTIGGALLGATSARYL